MQVCKFNFMIDIGFEVYLSVFERHRMHLTVNGKFS